MLNEDIEIKDENACAPLFIQKNEEEKKMKKIRRKGRRKHKGKEEKK